MNSDKLLPYIRIVAALAVTIFVSANANQLFGLFQHGDNSDLLVVFFQITVICSLSFIIHYLSISTKLPSFVVAIFFGLAAHSLLAPVVQHSDALGVLVGLSATLILFGGGLETPFRNFQKLFWKISSLSFIGLFLTAVLLSYAILSIGNVFNTPVTIMAAILLGAALASTDPAAIIPVLKRLRFRNRSTKDIIIAESALTDVTGSLLTIIFLSIAGTGAIVATVWSGYESLLSLDAIKLLVEEIFFGLLFGGLGYALLEILVRVKKKNKRELGVDAAFFMFVPMISFTAAVAFGGSGYLAAFVAGLLFMMTEHLHDTERYFNNTVDGFLKPLIFVLLGALVDVNNLITYMSVGLASAAVFMFIIRPLTAWISLAPFMFMGKEKVTWREIVFISFVRETGAIPAVLLVTIASLGFAGMEGVVAIGMWIILATLIVQPPLTPLVARVLKIATPIGEEDEDLSLSDMNPFVVLGSRGHSHPRRLPHVVEWAVKRHIHKIVLLICLEDRYNPELLEKLEHEAEAQFTAINKEREDRGEAPMDFTVVSRSGFLQENIDHISRSQKNAIAIFVGRKVLDYRLSEVKNLSVPLFFLE